MKLEGEATALRVRVTTVEGAVRSRDREIAKLAEMLRDGKSAAYETYSKANKAEEGVCVCWWGGGPRPNQREVWAGLVCSP